MIAGFYVLSILYEIPVIKLLFPFYFYFFKIFYFLFILFFPPGNLMNFCPLKIYYFKTVNPKLRYTFEVSTCVHFSRYFWYNGNLWVFLYVSLWNPSHPWLLCGFSIRMCHITTAYPSSHFFTTNWVNLLQC